MPADTAVPSATGMLVDGGGSGFGFGFGMGAGVGRGVGRDGDRGVGVLGTLLPSGMTVQALMAKAIVAIATRWLQRPMPYPFITLDIDD